MRILFIHEVNYLKKPIFEMHEFPESLAERGHEIFFLHFPEGSSRAELSELLWSKEISGRTIGTVKLTLLTPQRVLPGLLGRLLVALRGHWIVRAAIRTAKPDLVVTLAVPTYGWQAARVTRRAGIPLVYRALDVSHLIRGGMFRTCVKMAEKIVAKRADFVSANSAAMGEYIEQLGHRQDGVEVHYPPINLEMFRAGNREIGRKRIRLSESDRVILYMGSFFYFSGLPEVIREFARISPEPKTKLVLVGGGEFDSQLRYLVEQLNLREQVLFTGFVSFGVLPHYLAAADVLINPMKKSLVSDTALPNKIIQYLAASRPIVTTDLKGTHQTFGGYNGISWVMSPQQCISRALEVNPDKGEIDFRANQLQLDYTFGRNSIDRFERFLQRVGGSQ